MGQIISYWLLHNMDEFLLTKEELEALLKVVGNVSTTVNSAQSWLNLKKKLEDIVMKIIEKDSVSIDNSVNN